MFQQEDDNTSIAETSAGLLGAILIICSKHELLCHHAFSGNHQPENRYLGRTPTLKHIFSEDRVAKCMRRSIAQ
jgi:hypothetical protein